MAAPTIPGSSRQGWTWVFRSNPNLHRALKRPIQSADRSTAMVGWRRPEFSRGLGSKQIQNVLRPKRKDDDAECQNGEAECGCPRGDPRRKKCENHSTKERSSTERRFASFPARL